MNNFEDQKTTIVEELNKRIQNLQCPICSHKEMILADGFFNHPLSKDLSGNLVIGGPSIPTVATVCKNCGHIAEFAAGILGLLSKKEGEGDSNQGSVQE